MAEQQLVDYIKKAKQAGQDDSQTRSLLRKNGWTDEEISEAFLAVNQPKPEPRLEPRPELQPETQHQVSGKPEINLQQNSGAESNDRYQPRQDRQFEQPESFESERVNMPAASATARLFLKLLIVLILLVIIGAGLYFVLIQGDLLQGVVDKTLSYFSPKIQPAQEGGSNSGVNEGSSILNLPASPKPTTKNLTSVPQDYDAAKISLAAFSQTGDKVVYCAPLKIDYSKISCFLNEQKFLDNPYVYKPYWVGISPKGQRIIFLYYDSSKKQSFVFENGTESPRYDGTITSPKFSHNSQSFMYMVMGNDGKSFIVSDGKQFPPHDKIFTIPEWSDDGKYLFYGARDGENVFWIADEAQ